MVKNKKEFFRRTSQKDRLFMKWWFWVIVGFMFISIVFAIMPYPGCEETEKELTECEEALEVWLEYWVEYEDALDKYDKALEEYCEIDNTNPLCDVLLSGN